MKAVVFTQYGPPDVLQLREVEIPTPQANEVRVRVHAAPVNYGDVIVRNFANIPSREFNMPFLMWLPARIQLGYNKPKVTILGGEYAGVVDAVGKNVTRFKPGDEVFGYCGMSMGANAEYLCVAEDGMLALKPTNMSYEEAATIPYGGFTALTLLKRVNIQPGQKVLVNGASGAIGSHALQLAKYYGAEVTAVCGTPRLEMVKALGADHVMDYTKEDFTRSGKTYDVVFDVLGRGAFARWKQALNPNGRYLLASFKMRHLRQMLLTSKLGSRKVICALSDEDPVHLRFIKELAEAGKLKAIIDRCYPLEQTAEAHRYAESGRKKGNVIITLA